MAIQSNFPAIKPSLNLDVANTKKLDSRITFTRASTATYYDGVTTAKAEENLLLRSQDYSATWTVTNLTPVTGKTAPDSTSTATEFTATAANAVLTQGYTAIAGSYTFSVFLRRVTGAGDIQIAADNGTWTTKVITGTWARYDVTQTVAAGSKTAGVRVVTDTDAIEVWGAQLEQRSSVTSYTATTTQPITNYIPVLLTAANNVSRFDHNPTTNESLGLLIEESRTNLLTYSAEFDNAAWGKTRSSITSNTIVAPDGTLTGDKLVEDTTATNTNFVRQDFTLAVGTYTYSFFAKAAERQSIQCVRQNTNIDLITHLFNLSTGVATGTGASMTSVGNGWYRCVGVITVNAVAATGVNFSLYDGSTITYTGDGYSGLYLWGAQLEAGAFPTSYIATGAATATRSADSASMTGTNFSSWVNNAGGTLYVEYINYTTATGSLFSFDDGTANNRLIAFTNLGITPAYRVVVGGVDQALAGLANITVGTVGKMSFGYQVNNFAGSANGAAVVTDLSGTLPTSLAVARIGVNVSGAAALNGTIKRIAYYPVRLQNSQLQALTS